MTDQPVRKHPDRWLEPEDDPREPQTNVVGEKAILSQYLDHYRMTLELKCDGLDAEQLARRAVPPSTLSLLGLLRHLANVEHHWFRRALGGETDLPRLYRVDVERDFDFDGAVSDDAVVAEAWRSWRNEVAHGQAYLEGIDDLGATVSYRGEEVEVRDIIVHLIEEYARHVGHADLLRECIDGRTGQ
jgi:uncharacterized damage-inducible protein DinB